MRQVVHSSYQSGADLRTLVRWPGTVCLGPGTEPHLRSLRGPSAGLRLCQNCHSAVGTLQARLRTIGVLGNKHIPIEYLRGSEMQRRELLAGLLDTDGTVTAGGAVQFSVTSHLLARDVTELIVSLGYRCQTSTNRVRGRYESSSIAYTLTFSTEDKVFALERKAMVHKERRAVTGTARSGSRFIVDVRPIKTVAVRCVEVDNDSHMYLASKAMIPTHNSTLGLDFLRSCSIKHRMASVIFSLEMSKSRSSCGCCRRKRKSNSPTCAPVA